MSRNWKLIYAELGGAILGLILSFVFHFAFEWSGEMPSIAWLFAVNESVWEHSKLIFYPYLIYSIIEYFILRIDKGTYITAKAISLLTTIPMMLIMYYTYTGIIGTHVLWVDILITIIIVLLSYTFSYLMISRNFRVKGYMWLALLAFIVFVMLIVFTYYPPQIPLFFDNSSKIYGLG